jgi:glycosyltransferase involved in cell wall biosynthesis
MPRSCAPGSFRILFLTHVADPGGAEFKMLDLCREVGERAEVLLFQHGSLEALVREQAIPYTVHPMPAAARGVRRESGRLGIVKAIPAVLSMIGAVARKGREFDVIVAFSQKSFVVASLAKVFMRRPLLWFMNDILAPSHFSRTLIRLLVILSRYGADHIALNSQASLSAWRAAGGRQRGVSVIYPGIQDEQVVAQLRDPGRVAGYKSRFSPDARPLIGMFGRIGRWKGQEVFLRAIAKLPDVRAIIVGGALFGEEPYEAQIRRLAADLGIGQRVVFLGHVQDVMTLMAACDVVAHCSIAPEPFGLVIAEAMLAGTPVVASDAGGAREIVIPEETGQLTPLQDHEALAVAIKRYLADPSWAHRVADQAARRARELFSGTAMAAGFYAALAAL